jgi:hypothetical protein
MCDTERGAGMKRMVKVSCFHIFNRQIPCDIRWAGDISENMDALQNLPELVGTMIREAGTTARIQIEVIDTDDSFHERTPRKG